MKLVLTILGGLAAILVVLVIGTGAYLFATALRPSRPVGLQQVEVADGTHAPIEVTIWYPTDAKPGLAVLGAVAERVKADAAVKGDRLPVVVISHGTGGGPMSHADTALALASAGYVVAAPTHTGDNYRDGREVGTTAWLVDRARHIRLVDDFLLQIWKDRGHIDPERLGFFGFSAGGTTGLIAIGGEPDLSTVGPLCKARPEFVCTLLKPGPMRVPTSGEWAHDPRIKAAVIASPGFGFAFDPDGLSHVSAPVQLWRGAEDRSVPYATNAGVAQRLLKPPVEFHSVPNAEHFAFLTPCGLLAPALLCKDRPGFDRAAFHQTFNREVVDFFQRRLGLASTQ